MINETTVPYPWLLQPLSSLNNSWQAGRFHHGILLQGAKGLGKAALAMTTAKGMLCGLSNDLSACGQCKSCLLLRAGSHPDLCLIDNQERGIGIDEIRKISAFVQHKSHSGSNRVVIINQLENLSESAANALLKTLEEPAQQVYLLLTCGMPERVSATILSRCHKMLISVVDSVAVYHWLKAQHCELTERHFELLLKLSNHAPLTMNAWLQQLSASQLDEAQQAFSNWRNGQLTLMDYAKILERSDFELLLFQHLMQQQISTLICNEQSNHGEYFQQIQAIAEIMKQFADHHFLIKGQNRYLALLKLLAKLNEQFQ